MHYLELKGWEYTGRNLENALLENFYQLAKLFEDPTYYSGQKWNKQFQLKVANDLQLNSDGAVRTLKSILEKLGFIEMNFLNKTMHDSKLPLLTKLGETLLNIMDLDKLIAHQKREASITKENATIIQTNLEHLYIAFYQKFLLQYFFPNGGHGRGTQPLHPLRAALKAIRKYDGLDKNEWYLLNTLITKDDNSDDERELEIQISNYRNKKLVLSMDMVSEGKKGHQYFPQYLEIANLVNLAKERNGWNQITENTLEKDLIDSILSDEFLVNFYGK